MYSSSALNADLFTIAFCSNEAALAIGGVDARGVVGGAANITYVPAQKTYGLFWGYYLVYLESVSVDGTHLGHNIPDRAGNRYCINLVSVAGRPADGKVEL